MTSEPIKALVDQALDAFWGVIVKRHPQALTGDLSPGITVALELAAHDAISEWVTNNVPSNSQQ